MIMIHTRQPALAFYGSCRPQDGAMASHSSAGGSLSCVITSCTDDGACEKRLTIQSQPCPCCRALRTMASPLLFSSTRLNFCPTAPPTPTPPSPSSCCSEAAWFLHRPLGMFCDSHSALWPSSSLPPFVSSCCIASLTCSGTLRSPPSALRSLPSAW